MEYPVRDIERKWQEAWKRNQVYRVNIDPSRPKCYVLDMFPYPSGAGLHVGHPLGYIASDIYARYKRLKGFNVLHPMGYDAFGLPAEQYAIQTGQHPAVTTEQNIRRYREQLDNIGFCYDWDREVRTCDPEYYRWTQWIFLQLFNSWYNHDSNKAEPIETLIHKFEAHGCQGRDHRVLTGDIEHPVKPFTAEEWKALSEKERSDLLMHFRLAYLGDAWVNWCPALGTVLANDEVKDGVSERGGYPVERKQMKQWSMRITAYAERLLQDLDGIDWSDSIKEHQRNWIGKSEGCSVFFQLDGHNGSVEVFTTRPDTIYGVTFVTLAPEHELVDRVTTAEYRDAVNRYVNVAKNKTERERQAEKKVSGQFTGAYVLHPFTGAKVPVWVGEYVLAGYGTGAVMAVPAHDARDHQFARHFNLPIVQVIEAPAGHDIQAESWDGKEGRCINSGIIDGLEVKTAISTIIGEIEARGYGKGKTNYRLRDAAFGRQRYWGEPIPIYYNDDIPFPVSDADLPLRLPEIDKFLPTEDGEPPLARAHNWTYRGHPLETTTMPGWAASSWYFLRYMDPRNDKAIASKEAIDYWRDVDLYIGGSEHATGHLLYVRFWTKFLYDLGLIPVKEPARRLVNQGMIQGRSSFIFRYEYGSISDGHFLMFGTDYYLSKSIAEGVMAGKYSPWDIMEMIKEQLGDEEAENAKKVINFIAGVDGRHRSNRLYVDVSCVENDILDIDKLRGKIAEFKSAKFLKENGLFLCDSEVEKMSKSKWNVVNPDDMIEKYGADCFRLYEMFLGPLELSKPWNTSGISGTSNFIRKLWRLYHTGPDRAFRVSDDEAGRAELKVLHKLIKKVEEDAERLSFNTTVSAFMIAVNELTDLKCDKRSVLEPLAILVAPFAPHIAEELWERLGNKESVMDAQFPVLDQQYLVEDSFAYPISLNGKTKFNIEIALGLSKEDVEKEVLSREEVLKLLDGKTPKKIVVVPGRIVNIVV